MKLSEGFTELTQEEQEKVAGGGLLGSVFTGIYKGITNLLGLNTKNKINNIVAGIVDVFKNFSF